ncbi:GntR family transcriptional regulator [Ferdinandcohnia sp. Marseille-Q9671]
MEDFANNDVFSFKTEQVRSLRDIVVESLREAIITGQLKPGDHLKERELSEKMGVSTTPIKEAFRMLGHEGLVETVPRKGTYVSSLAETNIHEVQILRASVEGACAQLAAMKINEDQEKGLTQQIEKMEYLLNKNEGNQLVEENTKFHRLIRDIADNPMVSQILDTIGSFDKAFRKRALKEKGELLLGFTEHRKIYDAIVSRNPGLAEHLMKQHILRTVHDVLHGAKQK